MKEEILDLNQQDLSAKEKFGQQILPKISKVSYFLMFLGILFKLLHWPGASVFLILGFGTFAMLNFLNLNFTKSLLGKIISMAISLLAIGLLFKMLLWPNSTIMFEGGLFILIISTAAYLIKEANKDKILIVQSILLLLFGIYIYSLKPNIFFSTFIKDDAIAANLYEKMKNNPENDAARVAFQTYWRESRRNNSKMMQSNPVVTDSTSAE